MRGVKWVTVIRIHGTEQIIILLFLGYFRMISIIISVFQSQSNANETGDFFLKIFQSFPILLNYSKTSNLAKLSGSC